MALGFTSLTFVITLVVLGVYLSEGLQEKSLRERVVNNKLVESSGFRAHRRRRDGRRDRPGRPACLDSLLQHSVLLGC